MYWSDEAPTSIRSARCWPNGAVVAVLDNSQSARCGPSGDGAAVLDNSQVLYWEPSEIPSYRVVDIGKAPPLYEVWGRSGLALGSRATSRSRSAERKDICTSGKTWYRHFEEKWKLP